MPDNAANKRREFLKQAMVFGTGAASLPQVLQAKSHNGYTTNDGDGFTFLFQGDSITDGNRTRNNDCNHVPFQQAFNKALSKHQPSIGFGTAFIPYLQGTR